MPEFPCPGPITVDIRTLAGSVAVHAEPRETAEVGIAPYDDSDAAREAAENTRVELTGDRLVIASPDHGSWGLLRRPPRVRVTARVPTGSEGRFRTASADYTCDGEWSQLRLNTASGNAHLERTTGDLTVHTASGDIRAELVGGALRTITASGDVSAQRVAGPVDVKSATGDVRVDDAGSDVNLKTVSGDATVGAVRHGAVRVATVSGDVSVGVISGTGVWLDLNTLSGRTSSDLTMAPPGPPSAPTGEPAAGHDLTVQVRAVSGDIDVHRVTLPTPAA